MVKELNVKDGVVTADQIGDNVTVVHNYYNENTPSNKTELTYNNQPFSCEVCGKNITNELICEVFFCENSVCKECHDDKIKDSELLCSHHEVLKKNIVVFNQLINENLSKRVNQAALIRLNGQNSDEMNASFFSFLSILFVGIGIAYYFLTPFDSMVINIIVYIILAFFALGFFGISSNEKELVTKIREGIHLSGKYNSDKDFDIPTFSIDSKLVYVLSDLNGSKKEGYIEQIDLAVERVYIIGDSYYIRRGHSFDDIAYMNCIVK